MDRRRGSAHQQRVLKGRHGSGRGLPGGSDMRFSWIQNSFCIAACAMLAVVLMALPAAPDYRLLNLRYGEKFTPQDMDHLAPLPSGILGTVRLISGQ